jgi:glycosyltransferase involved in cell wall biosynthesis
MGIKLSAFTSQSDDTDTRVIPLEESSILYLGTLIKLRRLDFLVRVLALVRNDVPDATLYLVGRGDDPSDERLLETEAARLGVSSAVVFTGQLQWKEALRYVQEADVCLSPFYPTKVLNSTSPTKLVEYMALGRPVVANDHPEQKLIIEQSRAGICVPWDEDAFARAIVELLQNPESARKMGQRGPGYVAQHREYGMIAELVERRLLQIAELGNSSSVSEARPTNQ